MERLARACTGAVAHADRDRRVMMMLGGSNGEQGVTALPCRLHESPEMTPGRPAFVPRESCVEEE